MTDIASHSNFFDHLVELVPAKYYLDTDNDRLNLKFLKQNERAAAKATFKQQYKASKRSKLDPDKAKTTLELQQEAATTTEEGNGASHPTAAAHPLNLGSGGKPASREELKQRLQKKLEDLRQARKAEEQESTKKEAKQWREKALDSGRKAAQQATNNNKRKHPDSSPAAKSHPNNNNKKSKSSNDGIDKMRFSRIDFGLDNDRKKGKHKATKEALLATAEARQAQAGELVQTIEGRAKLEKEAWGTALSRAKGDKVKDDPKLLRRSIKKDTKLKAKKAAAWKDRVSIQNEAQVAKQQKRKDNLDARSNAKVEKKKVRREKKLMRAGFEGRKSAFIASPSPGNNSNKKK